jgi:hypothetical protein
MTRHLRVLTFGLIALSAVAPLAQTAATGRLKPSRNRFATWPWRRRNRWVSRPNGCGVSTRR